jgi:DNA-binding NarL/FixJ family response regulator
MTKKPSSAVVRSSIYIVDDHQLIRDSLMQLINNEPDLQVCGQAATYDEAKAEIEKVKPALAVVDIGLKDLSGIDLIREIRLRSPSTKILVLSMFDEALYAPKCFKAGARGYVMKSDSPLKVIEGIRTILKGDIAVSTALAQYVLRSVVGDEESVSTPVQDLLSARELEVFRMLGRGFSSLEIAEKMNLSRKTVQTYREHIKEKLGIVHSTELIQRATAWVFEEERHPASKPARPAGHRKA